MKQQPKDREQWKKRIRYLSRLRSRRELRLTPGYQTHEHLFQIVKKLPTDFEPYGKRKRGNGEILMDCSCGCRWFHKLAGGAGLDWGVCANPKSPRVGLLTFEHMGCPKFEQDKRFDFLQTASGKKMLQRHKAAERELQEWRDSIRWVTVRLRKRR